MDRHCTAPIVLAAMLLSGAPRAHGAATLLFNADGTARLSPADTALPGAFKTADGRGGARALILEPGGKGPAPPAAVLFDLDQPGSVEVWFQLRGHEAVFAEGKKPFTMPRLLTVRDPPGKRVKHGGGFMLACRVLSPVRVMLYLAVTASGEGAPDTRKSVVPDAELKPGVWRQFVVTWRPGGFCRLYFDGKFRHALIHPHRPPVTRGRLLAIGDNVTAAGNLLVDRVAFMDRELSEIDVASRFARSAAAPVFVHADVAPDDPKVRVTIDVNPGVRVAARTLELTVKDAKTGRAEHSSAGEWQPDAERVTHELDRTALTVGLKTVACTVLGQDGKPIGASGSEFFVPGEPPWARKRIALEALAPDHVPADWSELRVEGHSVVSDWKRITFGDNGLAASLQVDSAELLAAPAAIELVVNGRPATLKPSAPALRKKGRGVVEVAASAAVADAPLEIAVRTAVEYDFFCRHTVTVTPAQPCTIDRLTLRYRIRPEYAELCNAVPEFPDRMLPGPEAVKRIVSKRIAGAESLAFEFCPYFWLGGTTAGLTWNFESARDWCVANPAESIVYRRSDGGVSFNLVTAPLRVEKPLTYVFSMQPTPFKRMPKNWRTWNFSVRTVFEDEVGLSRHAQVPRAGVNKYIYWHSLWEIATHSFFGGFRDPERLQRSVASDHARGLTILPYIEFQLVTYGQFAEKDGQKVYYEDPVLKHYCPQWSVAPTNRVRNYPPPDARIIRDVEEWSAFWERARVRSAWANTVDPAQCRGFGDLLVWWMEQLVNKYGMDGCYMDSSVVRADYAVGRGPDGGSEVTDAKGRPRPVYRFSAAREHAKRVRFLIKQRNPEGLALYHMSAVRPAPYMSFIDVALFGEHFMYHYQPPDKRDASPNGDYYYAHIFGHIDDLKAEFFARPWGVPHLFLPELRGKDGKVFKDSLKGTRTMLAYILHFDVLIWPNWCATGAIYEWWRIKDDFGMAEDPSCTVAFVPYWENTLIRSNDPHVPVSYYHKRRAPRAPAKPQATPPPAGPPEAAGPGKPRTAGKPGGAGNPAGPGETEGTEERTEYLLIVSNLRFEKANITLAMPPQLAQAPITDVDASRPLAARPAAVTLQLPPYDFAILRITP